MPKDTSCVLTYLNLFLTEGQYDTELMTKRKAGHIACIIGKKNSYYVCRRETRVNMFEWKASA